jgi:hypothetical protein
MFQRTLSLLLACILLLNLGGCEGDEEQAIRDCYLKFATACENYDPDAAIQALSPDAIEHYDTMLQIAKNATGDQVRALPPHSLFDVAYIRHALPAHERQTMDGTGFIRHMVSNGLWVRPGGWEILEKIKVRKSSATAVVPSDRPNSDVKLDFLLVDGAWTIDFIRFQEDRSRLLMARASDEGIELVPLFMRLLELKTGKAPRKDLLDRP